MDRSTTEKSSSHGGTLALASGHFEDVAAESSLTPPPSDAFHSPEPSPLSATRTATPRPSLSRNVTRFSTHGTTYTSDPSFEVDWDNEDPQNPRNWPLWYKCLVLFSIAFSTVVVVLYSTAYTSAVGAIMEDLHVDSTAVVTLGLTTYLIGLAVGSVLLAPISETYGRRPVYIVCMFVFTVLIIPCARATDVTTLIVIRFFGAVAGSATIANAPGSIGDVISEDYRAIAFSVWSIGPMNGPVIGPVYGSWVTQYLGWRWMTWIVLVLGALSFLMMLCIKETYAPALLQAKARKMRRETGENRYWSRFDVKIGFLELMKVNLSRPFVMAVTEPICIFWNVYIAIIYAILYLCFASYPIVYHDQRGWSLGYSSLAFAGIGVGIMITICCASPIKKLVDSHKPDATGRVPPESMISIVCVASILVPVGELWFAWTCMPATIHPAASIAAGIPFGAGNAIVFIYASNYLVGSYGIYAASALAGNAVIRSVLGGVLPLAAAPLYRRLGPNWAGTFLGLLEVLIIPVPFVFYRYGSKIRERSTLIKRMREIEDQQERKRKKTEARHRTTEAMEISPEKRVTGTINKSESGSEHTTIVITDMDRDGQAEAELSRNRGLVKETAEDV